MKYNHKIIIGILLLLIPLVIILFTYPLSNHPSNNSSNNISSDNASGDNDILNVKKVRFNTDNNMEVPFETINKLGNNVKNLDKLMYVDYKDCASDLSCVIQTDQDIFRKTYKELEDHSNMVMNNRHDISKQSKGYMTDKELDGYAPDGLQYCGDLTMDSFKDTSLFYNAPSDMDKRTICRNCKIGYCLGDVCGSEIHKKPSDMPNYFY